LNNNFFKENNIILAWVDIMTSIEKKHSKPTDWLGLISFGFFLVLLGLMWIITPGLQEDIVAFFTDFELKTLTGGIVFPAPRTTHPVLYTAATQVSFVMGVLGVAVLVIRFALHDSLNRKAETISSIVFWFGAAFFLNMLRVEAIGWFGFLGAMIITLGLSIISSNLVRFFRAS
jgi:hypothetical protein